MNQSWFLYALFATICFGVGGALMKMPAARQQNRFVMAFWSVGFPFLFSLLVFWRHLNTTTPRLLWIAVMWGFFFSVARILYIESYHYADTNVVTPMTSSMGILFTFANGLLLFHDHLSLLEFLGLVTAFSAVAVFAFENKGHQSLKKLAYVLIILSLCSVTYKIFQKMGVDSGDIYAFQIWQFLFAAVFLFMLFALRHKDEIKKWHVHLSGPGILSGCMMGFLSFAGGIAYNISLTRGSFTLVNILMAMYLPVTIFTSYLLFQEQFTRRKAMLLGLALLSIILIRLG